MTNSNANIAQSIYKTNKKRKKITFFVKKVCVGPFLCLKTDIFRNFAREKGCKA